MKNVISWILTPIYYIAFGLTLAVFHIIQWVSLKLGGYQAHKISVDYFNTVLVLCLRILGIRFKFINEQGLLTGKPYIFVSNHQSLYDISPLYHFLKPYHIKFVAKKELGKWIPGISFNLKHGGSVLINRKNPRQAITALREFGKYIEINNYSAVLFPEGTRSKDGIPKKFHPDGLKVLMKFAPRAVIVPVTINHSWEIEQNGAFPLTPGVQVNIQVHKPVEQGIMSTDELIASVEHTIKSAVIR
ncbi:MAG: 1-acyl-sn-glycerol-3-phosphate acyltransferase [Bacteroidales bacterium]|nr:1-acyl-sn-glycerol-3-phosphate acyltransferase [Bacteroidales bacterium]